MSARDGMLDAAAEEMIERGYAASSLSSIAARLSLTKGAFAREFPTKGMLAHEIMESLARAIEGEHSAALAAFPGSGTRALARFLFGVDVLVRREPQVAAAISLLSDRALPALESKRSLEAWRGAVGELFERALADGEVVEAVEAADAVGFLAVSKLGATVLEVRRIDPNARERGLSVMRFALRAVGLRDVDAAVDDAIAQLEGLEATA